MTDNGLDACLRLVADRRRRRLLRLLRQDATGTRTVDELLDELSPRGPGSDADLVADRQRLAAQLYHTHLPKLDDHGAVEFDHETGTVRYRSDDRIESVLDAIPEEPSKLNP